ncbi:MAG: hypothetical protein O2856_01360 [Planctomycetota bacterium]|nr:hypothetical protein [Planctomycetota bacterium]
MLGMKSNGYAKVQDHAASTELRRLYASEHCGARLVWLSLIGLCFQLPLVGCVKQKTEAEIEPDEATSVTPEYVVRITEVAQKQAGLVFVPAVRRLTQDSINTTGWLQAVPGTEVVVRSPVAGYFSPESESLVLSVGQEVPAGHTRTDTAERRNMLARKNTLGQRTHNRRHSRNFEPWPSGSCQTWPMRELQL